MNETFDLFIYLSTDCNEHSLMLDKASLVVGERVQRKSTAGDGRKSFSRASANDFRKGGKKYSEQHKNVAKAY